MTKAFNVWCLIVHKTNPLFLLILLLNESLRIHVILKTSTYIMLVSSEACLIEKFCNVRKTSKNPIFFVKWFENNVSKSSINACVFAAFGMYK